MNDNSSDARELFIKYGGSHYEMERSGEYDKYLAFAVTPDQEKQWGQERCSVLLETVRQHPVADNAFQELIALIKSCGDIEGLRVFLTVVQQCASSLDTFTQLRFAEELFDTSRWLQGLRTQCNSLNADLLQLVSRLLEMASEQPFRIDPCYEKIAYLNGLLTEDRIAQRIDRIRDKVQAA